VAPSNGRQYEVAEAGTQVRVSSGGRVAAAGAQASQAHAQTSGRNARRRYAAWCYRQEEVQRNECPMQRVCKRWQNGRQTCVRLRRRW